MTRPPPSSPLFPYTPLFRSLWRGPAGMVPANLERSPGDGEGEPRPRGGHGWHDDLATQSLRSEEHTSELQSRLHLVCRLLLEKKKKRNTQIIIPQAVSVAAA